ncbi:MAG: CAAD domain-containing protein [Timaviella obliquedivisa GSE-PSE-MK23-08B]|nr:CAAD domain-containing protein [Timaviella obliquedivisa GSE-PSE-MK23-08B]
MTHDTMQTNEYNEITMEPSLAEVDQVLEQPLLPAASSSTELAEESLTSFQVQAANFFDNVTQSTVAFFKGNRQLLSNLGWLLLAFLGIRVLFASLDAIDDIPLMSSLLKLVGLITLVQFSWRHLVRANDRQELTQKIVQAKADLLGN